MMTYRFKDLVDIPKLQKLTDELFAATSIPSSIIDMDGEILTGSGGRRICTDFHRKHPEIEKECIESDTKIRKKLTAGEPYVIYECPRGLADASAPIIIEGEHVANVFLGQVFLSPPDDATETFFREAARKFGFDEADYLEAFREIPVFTEKEFRSGISFLTSLAQTIADTGLARIRACNTHEAEREITLSLLQALHRGDDLHLLIRDITILMQSWSGCEAVGIRLQEGEDFPYFETRGFPPEFVESERQLCARKESGEIIRDFAGNPVLECMCGNVICGRFNPDLPFFTPNGSFWTNSTTDLLASTTEADRQARTRNRCHGEGYESVALIPLCKGDQRIGLLQFNDSRRDRFDELKIALFENLASSLAIGLSQRITVLELKESENNLRSFLDAIPESAFMMNVNGILPMLNKTTADRLGKTPEEILGRSIYDFVPEAVGGYRKQVVEEVVRTKKPAKFEDERQGRSMYNNVTPVLDETGDVVRLAIVGVDITEQKQVEKALRDDRDLIERIMETSPAGIVRVDIDGQLAYANKRAEEILGIKLSETPGRTYDDPAWKISDFDGKPFPEENLPFFIVTRTGRPVFDIRHAIQRPCGKRVLLSINAAPLVDGNGVFEGIVSTIEDVTRHKLADDALKESDARFRSFMDHFPAHAFIKDRQLRYVYGNRALLEFFQVVPEKWMGTTARDHLSKEAAQVAERRDRIVLDEHRVVVQETMAQKGSGVTEWRRHIRFPLEMPNGEWLVGGISIDISELMRGKEERHRLIAAIEQAGESVVITARDGTIEYANPAFETITGYPRQETLGRTPRILKSGHQDASVYKTMWETILSGDRWTGRLINKRKDGTTYTSECAISPIKNKSGGILNFVWISRDISNEVALEKRMVAAQKMESIGNLAGGIAHDFNNILFPILGLTEMLLEDLPSGSTEHENAGEIYKAGKRGSELVKQILAFSRRADQQKLPVRIQQILREVFTLIRATIPSYIEIAQDIQKDCGRVLADPTQLHQIAMNLITNAFHAVEETGGKITVRLKEATLGQGGVPHASLEPGHYAVLSVSDTGCGIDPMFMDKIFEPYFTTKSQEKGTGLGLAVVYGIVKEYHGDIEVFSELGKGTTFNIYLPLVEDSIEQVSVANGESLPTGTDRILLVDDEKPVARLVKQMLERFGYRVTVHTSSVDALNDFMAHPDDFDLVMTDMTMPNMTGVQLAKKMMSVRPDIPIIICTGFSEKINGEKANALGIKGLLMKPISKSAMAEMVRTVLETRKDA